MKTNKVICDGCDGSGENQVYPERDCFSCDGKGIIMKKYNATGILVSADTHLIEIIQQI